MKHRYHNKWLDGVMESLMHGTKRTVIYSYSGNGSGFDNVINTAVADQAGPDDVVVVLPQKLNPNRLAGDGA